MNPYSKNTFVKQSVMDILSQGLVFLDIIISIRQFIVAMLRNNNHKVFCSH